MKAFESVDKQIARQVESQVGHRVYSQIDDRARRQIGRQVRKPVGDQIGVQVESQVYRLVDQRRIDFQLRSAILTQDTNQQGDTTHENV